MQKLKHLILIQKIFQFMQKTQPKDLVISITSEYKDVNLHKDIALVDYQNLSINWGHQQDFEIIRKVGRGKYAQVFQGIQIPTQSPVAIKILHPIRKSKIKRQYHIMNSLKHPNIVKLIKGIRCSQAKTASFVFEYVPHQDFRELYPKLNLNDIKFYIKELLNVLDYIHSEGIFHRDIKPHNILINHEKRSLKIIDFGLAQYYYPQNEYSSRVSSLYYKAPELLLGNTHYDYRIDIWAVGVILAGLIFKKNPFVVGIDAMDQLYRISKILGTEELLRYIKKNKNQFKQAKQLRQEILNALQDSEIKKFPKSDFKQFINKENSEFATPQALDLIQSLLRLDFNERITAKLALKHSFFQINKSDV